MQLLAVGGPNNDIMPTRRQRRANTELGDGTDFTAVDEQDCALRRVRDLEDRSLRALGDFTAGVVLDAAALYGPSRKHDEQ